MDVEQPAFGQRLLALRQQRRLSQTDLAGAGLSPSYVSLLENGRRIPTRTVVEQLAAQLQVNPEQLAATTDPERDDDLVWRMAVGATARDERDLESASSIYRGLAADADEQQESEIAWSARWELAEVLRGLDRLEERRAVLQRLSEDATTADSPRLRLLVHTALADACRHTGYLDEARTWARRAVDEADRMPAHDPAVVRAWTALLSVHAEHGDLVAAERIAQRLENDVEGLRSPALRSSVHWAVGNVHFLAGRADEGTRHHDQAFAHAVAPSDPRQWGRLCKASAVMRLRHGGDPATAAELLATSRHYLTVAGTPTDIVELLAAEAQLAQVHGEHKRVRELTGRVLDEPAELSLQDLATTLVVRSRSLWELGKRSEATAALRRAGESLDSSGAHGRASTVWRELSERLEHR
jgi:transcriptional regulator with XRE-family HTH domain